MIPAVTNIFTKPCIDLIIGMDPLPESVLLAAHTSSAPKSPAPTDHYTYFTVTLAENDLSCPSKYFHGENAHF